MAESVKFVSVRMRADLHDGFVRYAAAGGESVNAAINRLVDEALVMHEHELAQRELEEA